MISRPIAHALGAAPPYTREDFDHSPLVVFYELTRACDLLCLHCRACAQADSDPHELTPIESRALIDQIAGFPRRPLLVLTGGDPLKRPDIYDLVRYATAAGLQVAVTPSATPLVTPAALSRLQRAGMKRLAISLDGADPPTHDGQRGVAGIFARTLDILRDARELGIPTQVNTTLTPENIDQIDALADLLATLGVVLWSVFYIVPVGRATESRRLDVEQYERSFAQLANQMECQPFAIKTTEAPHFRRFLLEARRRKGESTANFGSKMSPSGQAPMGINDGKGVMFVSHVGLIHPSGFMPIVCGMFRLANVVDVYQRSAIFQGLRDSSRLEGKCGRCEYRKICGGSRARAYAVSGNPFAEEPDCVYVPGTPK
jgi:radical SAM protein